ncbi:DUF6065 family protein [Knoellia aerolata]|uniref:DUF6065 family protein n=1 Tax=Knoellia aerolata TaxID=442954 RepID=UPI0012ED0619|nr:DUF6065 family protein [Knoellia aerolata]
MTEHHGSPGPAVAPSPGHSRLRLPVTGPEVSFHHFFPDGPMPVPTRAILRDLLPAKAVKRCPPVTVGSSYGWLLFPPTSFAVRWVKEGLEFALMDDDGRIGSWQVLDSGRPGRHPGTEAALAGVPEHRLEELREALGDGGVPLVDPNPADPREFQIFTGVTVRTAPGWASLVRPIPNLPVPPDTHDVVDGVVETAWYGNGLPVMVRLRSRDEIVRFARSTPIAAIQPVPVAAFAAENSVATTGEPGLGNWDEDEWERFVTTRRRRLDSLPGSYRRAMHAHHHEAPPEQD